MLMEKLFADTKYIDESGEIIVLELGGYVDQSNNHQVEKLFENIIDSGCYKVIVDFSKVTYMSSAGWGVFIGEIKRFRDRGGDIKLANMNPDLYEVFQMLEFYHIFEDYSSIAAAKESFMDHQGEMDLVTDEEQTEKTLEAKSLSEETEESVEEIDLEYILSDGKSTEAETQFSQSEAKVNSDNKSKVSQQDFVLLHKESKLADLPLQEKIKRIIAQNPLVNIFQIRKILKHEHFGHTRVGIVKLYKILRDMDLHTKAKRYRFYQSC